MELKTGEQLAISDVRKKVYTSMIKERYKELRKEKKQISSSSSSSDSDDRDSNKSSSDEEKKSSDSIQS